MKHIDWYFQSTLPRKDNNGKVYKTLCSKYVKAHEIDNENSNCERCKQVYAYAKSVNR